MQKPIFANLIFISIGLMLIGTFLLAEALTHPPQSLEGVTHYPPCMPEIIEIQKALQKRLFITSAIFYMLGSTIFVGTIIYHRHKP